ncbi:MAG: hypothetical protein A2669_01875 [Candidatus Yanofskybacteria bacterium RIFCSPHIGHO2_01_FULL_48_25b]|uniref:Uncharacterized protein n=1 Tax=Candidatus Yanofskybacteria bacterium RIFCSPHIGHO2_01_FULL_48_25b TaxID=1802672 RepID=A0A1F8F5C6_9BACT|nr:MAG: hypothetical protein A2669_01875 [Candidatus Yanofskybacteria bacterium RIFCSPHIGHO2_01_FULL_48_25b]
MSFEVPPTRKRTEDLSSTGEALEIEDNLEVGPESPPDFLEDFQTVERDIETVEPQDAIELESFADMTQEIAQLESNRVAAEFRNEAQTLFTDEQGQDIQAELDSLQFEFLKDQEALMLVTKNEIEAAQTSNKIPVVDGEIIDNEFSTEDTGSPVASTAQEFYEYTLAIDPKAAKDRTFLNGILGEVGMDLALHKGIGNWEIDEVEEEELERIRQSSKIPEPVWNIFGGFISKKREISLTNDSVRVVEGEVVEDEPDSATMNQKKLPPHQQKSLPPKQEMVHTPRSNG